MGCLRGPLKSQQRPRSCPSGCNGDYYNYDLYRLFEAASETTPRGSKTRRTDRSRAHQRDRATRQQQQQ